ncbi:hypothetical protein ACOMHN_017650 [Nucella lapillus]
MSRFRNKNNCSPNATNTPPKRVGHKTAESGQDIEMTDMKNIFLSESSGLSVHQFARDIVPVHQQINTSLMGPHFSSSNLHSYSVNPRYSEENPKLFRNSEKLVDNLSDGKVAASENKKPAPNKVQTTSMEILKANADDDDLDLSSLRDLMESMRQAAKEIREITHPVHTGKPKKKDHASRPREQKRHHKKKHAHRRSSGHHQQIQAEIHVMSEVLGQNVSTASSETSQLSLPAHTEEGEHPSLPSSPPSSPPSAFLYVENEELCNTWPKRRGRSVSRQRSMTEQPSKLGTFSEGSSPMVLGPDCNLWLHPPNQSAPTGRDCQGSEKLTVHQSSHHDSSESGTCHRGADFQALTMPGCQQQSSRGRPQQRSAGRVLHPASPSPSPFHHPSSPPTSPPPHIFVSEHDVFHQHYPQQEGVDQLQTEPADQQVTIDIV